MIIKEITNLLEELAPLEYALDWDNCGLQVGNLSNKVKKVAIALTPTVKIIEQAIEQNCNLLITHHPLIFSPLKNIKTNTPIGKSLELALKNNLTIYTMHTNFDSAESGLNYVIANDLGLDNIEVLSVTKEIELLKLVTFVPEEFTLKVINSISGAGAGHVGKLSHCSYITAGIATFIDDETADKGEILDMPNKEPEDRLEVIVPRNNLDKVLAKLKESHPYQDIIYDIYKLEGTSKSIGIGVLGEFYTPFTLSEVIDLVKRNFNLSNLTFVGNKDKVINKVAICTGSGGSFMNLAKQKGADLYITGDVKYHTAIDAKDIDLAMIDAGHHGTEIICVPFISKYLKENLAKEVETVELLEKDPFSYA